VIRKKGQSKQTNGGEFGGLSDILPPEAFQNVRRHIGGVYAFQIKVNLLLFGYVVPEEGNE
jgi:hypothetical protein